MFAEEEEDTHSEEEEKAEPGPSQGWGGANPKRRMRSDKWTVEEHKRFLIGLAALGKGNWRGISRHFVHTRTPVQVASHAQKHFIRQMNGRKPTKKNKQHRAQSNFDLTLNTDNGLRPSGFLSAIGRGMGGEPARGGNPGVASTPDLHVRVQVAFMREGDFASAFEMNSAANRARLGDVDTFRSMVLSQPAFAALAAHEHELLRYGEKKTGGSEGAGRKEGKHSVEYCISGGKDDEQPYTFLFDVRLGRDTRTYETESVRVVC